MGVVALVARLRTGLTRRDERGAAAVEFALVLPLLLLLLFGIIAYGYMLSFRGSMSQAAAEGARAAAVSVDASKRESNARAAVEEALQAYGVSCSDPGMACAFDAAPAGCASGTSCFQVRLTYDYDDEPLIPLPFVDLVMPDEIGYSASARTS